jgi:SAM-dependent methyltransferase
MLDQARARPGAAAVGWRRARAERLPFRAGWFDAAHAHLVLHLLDDRAAALAELARVLVPGGRLLVATFEPDHFSGFHLAPYFPSIEPNDRARFPDPALVVAELADGGFVGVERERVSTRCEVDPAALLERVRGRYISSLSELAEDEYRTGLERLERDVRAGAGPSQQRAEWCLISAVRG